MVMKIIMEIIMEIIYKNIKKISYKNSMSIYKTKQIDGYELIPQINSKTIKNLFPLKSVVILGSP